MQLLSIQYLRAIAAIMVVIFHCFYSVEFMRPDLDSWSWLRAGVDIFFVISGYVMVVSTRDRDISPQSFALRRIVRIVPIYWIATAIMISVLMPTWDRIATSLFFFPATGQSNEVLQPLVMPGWTLNYEMFFYAMFAATLLVQEKLRLPIMAFALTGLATIGWWAAPEGVAGFYTSSITLEFLFGMAIAQYRLRLHWLFIPIGFAALVFVGDLPLTRALASGVPAAAIVAGSLSLEKGLPRWQRLLYLGDASYAIYLFHIMALGFFVKAWPILHLDSPLFVPAALCFVLPVGCLIHAFLEKPVTDRLNARLKKKASPQLAVPNSVAA